MPPGDAAKLDPRFDSRLPTLFALSTMAPSLSRNTSPAITSRGSSWWAQPNLRPPPGRAIQGSVESEELLLCQFDGARRDALDTDLRPLQIAQHADAAPENLRDRVSLAPVPDDPWRRPRARNSTERHQRQPLKPVEVRPANRSNDLRSPQFSNAVSSSPHEVFTGLTARVAVFSRLHRPAKGSKLASWPRARAPPQVKLRTIIAISVACQISCNSVLTPISPYVECASLLTASKKSEATQPVP